MTRFLTICVALLVVLITPAALGKESHQSDTHGFEIEPPAMEAPGNGAQQVAIYFLPASDGFAPNINIQLQPWKQSLKAYQQLSEQQFKQAGLKVVKTSATEHQVTFEYTGSPQGRPMHFYSTATLKDDRIYLVSATALSSQWPSVKNTLKRSVDSFKLQQP